VFACFQEEYVWWASFVLFKVCVILDNPACRSALRFYTDAYVGFWCRLLGVLVFVFLAFGCILMPSIVEVSPMMERHDWFNKFWYVRSFFLMRTRSGES